MKRYFYILAAFVLFLSSCEKDTEGVSKETAFANFEMTGDPIMFLKPGATFTDPGVKATENGAALEVKSTGTVNTSVTGVYQIDYAAVNSDGYPGTTSREVVVFDVSPDVAEADLSGSYARDTNGSLAVFTKIAPGVYLVSNPGGAPGTNLVVIAFHISPNSVAIPEQVSNDGSITSSTGNAYNPATKTLVWTIRNPGYGTAARTFTKQ